MQAQHLRSEPASLGSQSSTHSAGWCCAPQVGKQQQTYSRCATESACRHRQADGTDSQGHYLQPCSGSGETIIRSAEQRVWVPIRTMQLLVLYSTCGSPAVFIGLQCAAALWQLTVCERATCMLHFHVQEMETLTTSATRCPCRRSFT